MPSRDDPNRPRPAPAPEGTADAAILDAIDQGFCIIEVIFRPDGRPIDYRFLRTNTAFESQTGLKHATGRTMRELAPAHEEAWFETYATVARTGRPVRFVQEAKALGRWFDVYAFRLDPPEADQVAILFTDISSRIRSEQNTRLLADVSEALITLTREEDLPGIIRRCTAGFFRFSQCGFVELDLDRRLAVVPSIWEQPSAPRVAGTHALAELIDDGLWQESQAGRTVAIPDLAQAPGITRPAYFEALGIRSLLSIPLQRGGGWRILFVVGRAQPGPWLADEIEVARELAARCWTRVERLRAEVALSASEERLRLILENAREYAIFAMDLERRVTSWSEGAERLLGHRADDILGRTADVLFTPEDIAAGAPVVEAQVALRDGRAANERWHMRADGSRFWGSGAMMAMRDARGATIGLLKILRDSTDARLAHEALKVSRTRLEEALRMAEKARAEAEEAAQAKDRFLAALSHELRTPLNPVLMVAGEQAGNPALPRGVREDFEMIQRNVEHEARLIDDMLDLSRIARGKISLHRQPVDLASIVREVMAMVSGDAAAKRLELTLDWTGDASPIVVGDPARLRQVFLNLLNNAIKFTPEGGRITLAGAAGPGPGEWRVAVADSGIGLTADEVPLVFEAFTQGRHAQAGARSYGGLGLGLAIVRELVDRHGGRVTVESAGRGRGATFTVVLPLASAATAAATAPPRGPAGPIAARTILLVEDHGPTRAALERMLVRRGHTVVPVSSVGDAKAAVQARPFDLLISDIGLPDGDGVQLLCDLRGIDSTLPAIALTGFGMESDIKRSEAAGFARHLVKPVAMAQLDAAIAAVFAAS